MKRRQHGLACIAALSLAAVLFAAIFSGAQSAPAQLEVPNAPIPTHVLVQSPAETKAELQVICLFRSDRGNTLRGALAEMDEKLDGLLSQIRKPSAFGGEWGETLLITPARSKITAKRIMLVGLGDLPTFTPQRMELVGAIVYREAKRMGVKHPFFAPTVLDGGVTKFTTAETAEWFIRGFLRGAATEKQLAAAGAGSEEEIQALTYLAGPSHAQDTRDGIARAYQGAE